MNCPTCGNANPDAAAFCQVCYEVLGKKASPAQAAAAPPPATKTGVRDSAIWPPARIAAAALVFAIFVLTRQWLERAFWILDWVDLAFHEGGHVVFALLGNRFIYVAGGTIMQLLIPFAAMVHFLKRKEKISAYVALFWVGQNFLGIGKYIADARAQQLDLVAGGVHDWTYLLETLGLLIHDEGLGKAAALFGCLVMAVAVTGAFAEFTSARRE